MNTRGFIALTSVLIISAVLLVTALGAGAGSVHTRMNMLGTEFKVQSSEIANSCVGYIRLRLRGDPAYGGNETVSLDGGTCSISAIASVSGARSFSVTSVYKNAHTVLSVALDADGAPAEEKEIPNAPL